MLKKKEMIMSKVGVIFIVISLLSAMAVAGPKMYVPMGNANDIVIIDLETDKIVGRIDELENAHGLSSSPNSEYLVAGSMKPQEHDVPASPDKPAAVSEEEHLIHHAGGNNNNINPTRESYLAIVHPKHGHVMRRVSVRSLTHHTAVSPNGKIAVAVHSGAGGISVVDLEKMLVIKEIDTGQWPNYAVFSKDGSRLYVSNTGVNTISEIDTNGWKMVRELKAGKEPEHMVLGVRDRMLYVANKGDASASAIDLTSGVIKQTYAVGDKPHGIDVSDDGRWLFVASKKSGLITRIDLANGERRTVKFNPAPYHLAYIKNHNKFYVSSRKEAKIWVLDPESLVIKTTIGFEHGVAHQMVIRDE